MSKGYQYKFVKLSIALLGRNCQICNSDKNVYTHHKDMNPRNNPLDGSNWQRICPSCHCKLHWLPRKKWKTYKEGKIFHSKIHSKMKQEKKCKLIEKEIFNNFKTKNFLKTSQLQQVLGITRQRIAILREQEMLPYCKIGGSYFYPSNFKREFIKNKSYYSLPTSEEK